MVESQRTTLIGVDMTDHSSIGRRRRWLKPSRIVPSLTIIGAGIAIVLSTLKIIQLNLAENIIIALLGLLAIDALTERLSLLEKIDVRLGNIPARQKLKPRAQMIGVEAHAAHALEICIVAISGISLSYRYVDFFERKIRDGCKIRIVLLNPDSTSIRTWEEQSKVIAIAPDIRSSLAAFGNLLQIPRIKGKYEIRLSEVFAPFSMLATDLNKDTGSMNVEYHLYNNTFAKIEVARTRLLSYRWVSCKHPQRRNDKSLCRTL